MFTNRRNYFICLLFSLVLCCKSYVNGNTIEFIFDENHLYVKELRFVDSTGVENRFFDIKRHNPYDSLPYPILEKNLMNYSVYDLAGYEVEDFIPESKSNGSFFSKEAVSTGASVHEVTGTPEAPFIAVSYLFILRNNQGIAVGALSSVYVLDNKGMVVNKMNRLSLPVQNAVVSNDGLYLGFVYGETNKPDDELTAQGLIVYDLSKHEIFINEKAEAGYSMNKPQVIKGIMAFTCYNPIGLYKYILFDFKNSMKYWKIYSNDEISSLEEISEDAFIFNSHTDYYGKVFMRGKLE